jgi:hypothetical protein
VVTQDQLETLTLNQLRAIAKKIDFFFPVSINGKVVMHREVIDFILTNQKV